MSEAARFQRHLDIDAEAGPVEPLAVASGLSRQRVKQVMQQGAVWLERAGHTRRLRRASATLQPGDRLHLYYDEQVLAQQPAPARLLLDRGDFSAWYKPAGMLSQGSRWGDHCTLVRWAEQHLVPERSAFIVHRLDRATRGVMLLAHGKRSAAALAALFRDRAIDKRYRAWVHGHFPATEQCYAVPIDGRDAVSRARLLRYDAATGQSLVEVAIETGRKHQVRRHLAGGGFPVAGDRRYGIPADRDGELQLVAAGLVLVPPGADQPLSIELPAELLPI